VYFHHFLRNLCWSLIRAGQLFGYHIPDDEMDVLWLKLVQRVKVRLDQHYPNADPDFLLDVASFEYDEKTLVGTEKKINEVERSHVVGYK